MTDHTTVSPTQADEQYDLTNPPADLVPPTAGLANEPSLPVEQPAAQEEGKKSKPKAKVGKDKPDPKTKDKKETEMPVAPPKKSAKSAAAKAATAKAAVPTTNGLTNSEVRVLHLLSQAEGGLNRAQLAAKTGVKRGWSKLLGAPTKEGGANTGLEGRGLVRSAVTEGTRGLVYTITTAGRKEMAKAER